MKALIVDDEAPARERMRQLLGAFDDIEIVGQAGDGEEALRAIQENRPDVVFLDIQMPGISGLEVAASLPSPRPLIVFCTAYDQYAVDAFEMFALDYLLKPVTRARLKESVERARLRSSAKPDAQQAGMEERLDEALRKAGRPIRFLARHKSGFQVVPEAQVLYFGSEEGYTKLCTSDKEYWIDPTLADLEGRLDESLFFRISRSALVRLEAVAQVDPMPGGHGQLTLRNGVRLDISRRRMRPLLDRLETG